MTAGGSTPAARSAMRSSRSTIVVWRSVAPQRTTATGVDGGRPWAISRSAMRGSALTPMRTTSVSTPMARRSHSTRDDPHASWPVTTANEVATPRCVTGMPAYAGTATAELTPGTTSNGMPASASVSASSPPRPNTNGSPPLSRTTRRPRRACWTSRSLISPCGSA